MRTLAVIPARGGSKRLPNKNLRPLLGKPLIAYMIESALVVSGIDRLVVSTEDVEIAEVAEQNGAEVPCLRPRELADDSTPTLPVLEHMVDFLEKEDAFEPECIVTLQATSPLCQPRHIQEALELFERDPEADSLLSVIDISRIPPVFYRWTKTKRMKYCLGGYLERWQDALEEQQSGPSDIVARNSAIYIIQRDKLGKFGSSVVGGRILGYLMEPEYSVDIDDEFDFLLAELLLKKMSVSRAF